MARRAHRPRLRGVWRGGHAPRPCGFPRPRRCVPNLMAASRAAVRAEPLEAFFERLPALDAALRAAGMVRGPDSGQAMHACCCDWPSAGACPPSRAARWRQRLRALDGRSVAIAALVSVSLVGLALYASRPPPPSTPVNGPVEPRKVPTPSPDMTEEQSKVPIDKRVAPMSRAERRQIPLCGGAGGRSPCRREVQQRGSSRAITAGGGHHV